MRNRNLIFAFGVALLIHGAAFAVWVWQAEPAPEAGASALRFSLGGVPTQRPESLLPLAADEEVIPPQPEPEAIPEPAIKPIVQPELPVPVQKVEQTTPSVAPVEQTVGETAAIPNLEVATNGQGQASADAGLGSADIRADYKTIVAAWLNRHKRYPRAAARRGLEGKGELTFTVTRRGAVTHFMISATTGFAVLDRELQAMLKRAEPLPAFPDDLQQVEIELTVPVNFNLEN